MHVSRRNFLVTTAAAGAAAHRAPRGADRRRHRARCSVTASRAATRSTDRRHPVDARDGALAGGAGGVVDMLLTRELPRIVVTRDDADRALRAISRSRSTQAVWRPATTYYYRFQALGERSPTGRTRTLPVASVTARPAGIGLLFELSVRLLQRLSEHRRQARSRRRAASRRLPLRVRERPIRRWHGARPRPQSRTAR